MTRERVQEKQLQELTKPRQYHIQAECEMSLVLVALCQMDQVQLLVLRLVSKGLLQTKIEKTKMKRVMDKLEFHSHQVALIW